MGPSFDIWKMLTGVAFFLLAMHLMENALRHLAGRKFKLFLKKQTDSKVKAIGGAAIVTGLLQSSSIVNLLVLSMVGAHILQMENALALTLGANVGTTITGWIFATLGFDFNIETIVLPVAGIAGIIMAFSKKEGQWFLWFEFLFSLAFLFVAFGFIKSGMEAFVKQTDLAYFSKYPVIVFLVAGILITAVIQSSSATIAITLSALFANAITLYAATAIVLGSEIGTTFKLFLASADGMASKKRVALGNFIFNAVTVFIVYLMLRQVNRFITEGLQVQNELIALVFFQTMVNLLTVILFFPFLKPMSKFLLKRFPDYEDNSLFILKVPVKETNIALEALERETAHFIRLVLNYSLHSFKCKATEGNKQEVYKRFYDKDLVEKYKYIKHLHGEIHSFYIKLQNEVSDKNETERLDKLISAIRNMMYAAKNINDAQYDIDQFSNSSNDIKYNFYTQSGEKVFLFCERVKALLNSKQDTGLFEDIAALYYSVTNGYSETLKLLYKQDLFSQLSEIEITSLINFNRELYTSFKSVLYALKDYRLSVKESAYFDSLPGFIR